MGAARPIFGLLALGLVAAGVVLQFFIVLSGTRTGTPTDLTYFLQASTNGIDGVRNPSRWTYWSICGADGDRNVNCGASTPALPFDPPRNFGSDSGIAEEFLDTRKFYLLSRFSWVFYIIAPLFGVLALLTGVLALCTRIGAYISAFNSILALLLQTLAAALMTAWSVEGRNLFRDNGQEASLGMYGYGFSWGAVAAFLLSTVLFCIGGSAGGRDMHHTASTSRGRFGRFGRKRNVQKEYVHDSV